LRHAVDGLPDDPAERLGDLDAAEFRKHRPYPALNGRGEMLRAHLPGGLGAGPHQAVALDDAEMVDAVSIADGSLELDDFGKLPTQRYRHGGVTPDRQQRLRQS